MSDNVFDMILANGCTGLTSLETVLSSQFDEERGLEQSECLLSNQLNGGGMTLIL